MSDRIGINVGMQSARIEGDKVANDDIRVDGTL